MVCFGSQNISELKTVSEY